VSTRPCVWPVSGRAAQWAKWDCWKSSRAPLRWWPMKMSKPICSPKKASRSFCTSTRELGALLASIARQLAHRLRDTSVELRSLAHLGRRRATGRKLAFVLTPADKIDQGSDLGTARHPEVTTLWREDCAGWKHVNSIPGCYRVARIGPPELRQARFSTVRSARPTAIARGPTSGRDG
jgi:hypothetical protein